MSAGKREYDPLLECLVLFAKNYHRPVSVDALIAGLPTKPGEVGPELFSIHGAKGLFSRVAERAGFASRLIKRDLEDLSDLLLPCILILAGRNACILEEIDHADSRAKVIFPEIGEGEEWIAISDLKEQYLGFAFLLKQSYRAKEHLLRPISPHGDHWFWGTLKRSSQIYTSVILASVMINLFVLATPLFTMNVYDRVVPNNAIETLWVLALGVATIYLFDLVLRFARTYLLEVAGKKSDVIMSSILFERILDLRMKHWPKSIGALASRMNQFESIRGFFTASTLATLVDLPFAVIFLLAISYIGGPLVAVPLITMGLLLAYSLLLVRPLKNSVENVFEASAHKHSLLVESLNAIETIKTVGTSRHTQWEWEEATGEIANRSLRARTLSGSVAVVTNLLVQMNMIGIVVLGVYEIVDLELSLGALIAVVILAQRAISPMAQVAMLITNYQQAKAAYVSLERLMNTEVERPEGQRFVRRPDFEGTIEFKNVDFAYPEAEKPVLSEVSFKIEPGEHVGIIGRVGSGKTTVAKLLLGLYGVDNGSLIVDGIEINQIDPADLRHGIAYLSQDLELMRGSIRENIVLKNPRAGDEAMLAAARIGGVDLFLNRMPLGYDSPVGECGHALSGGQRQCVALARTVLLEEPVVVLDEPTNSMDNSTEAVIRGRLYDYTRDKTLILITHKLAMLDLVERLIVIEEGRVVMDGRKDDVITKLQARTEAA